MTNKLNVVVVYDIGKTNKKLILYNDQYKIVFKETIQVNEIQDEDGFICENIEALKEWILSSLKKLIVNQRFEIKAINMTAYGASFVYLDKNLNIIAPLYSYLKPFPEALREKFYNTYGGYPQFAKITASPSLGSLNSGMQIYRIKYEQPDLFNKIQYALHLPQFISFLLTSSLHSELTSIGCHTNMWDFKNQDYHKWIYEENIINKLPGIKCSNEIAGNYNKSIPTGVGLHDSSSALIPYLYCFKESFVLLSTGTWCISLNPFNNTDLEEEELKQDCLCYLSHEGKSVKASRLFSGNEHEQQVKRLAQYFNMPVNFFTSLQTDFECVKKLKVNNNNNKTSRINIYENGLSESNFAGRDMQNFSNYSEAYHQLIMDIVQQQVYSTRLVLKGCNVKKIFVDGGFSKNEIYMNLLALAFPETEVYAASISNSTALGAALVLHHAWNSKLIPTDLIEMKLYRVS